MDVSDLTLEKVITSRSMFSSSNKDSIIVEEAKDPKVILQKRAHALFDFLNEKDALQRMVEETYYR